MEAANEFKSSAVLGSDFISGGETVNVVSKILDRLARRDKSFSTTIKTQFQPRIDVHLMGNSPRETGYEFDG
jgi:hypothetical protein